MTQIKRTSVYSNNDVFVSISGLYGDHIKVSFVNSKSLLRRDVLLTPSEARDMITALEYYSLQIEGKI